MFYEIVLLSGSKNQFKSMLIHSFFPSWNTCAVVGAQQLPESLSQPHVTSSFPVTADHIIA
jgi:hypothetical protein